MTIIDHTFLCKWPNLRNRQGFKYLFSPLYKGGGWGYCFIFKGYLGSVRDLFHPFQDCNNLRIKTHTTKNIINNKLLLWRRGVNGVRPLLQPTLLREERSGFRTLFKPSLNSLVPCNRLYAETISQNMQENTPILYHPVLGSKDKNVFLRPSKTLTLQK